MNKIATFKPEPVVLLVDDRTRDLDGATLIAYHLRQRGIECHLEPLEAFRAVLATYRPGLMIFNHLNGSHLVSWSKRLKEMGVLTAVLLNEGFVYDAGELRYLAGRYHSDAHVDYFFCWNELHKEAILKEGSYQGARLEVIGVPRFDFYHEPWSRIHPIPRRRSERPRVLVCTNFVTAHYWELPKSEADRFFAPWVNTIPLFKNYWRSVEAHWLGREKLLVFLQALIDADKYEVVLRPHPREDRSYYDKWMAGLSGQQRNHITIDARSPIAELILGCDLEISCETCTTALESWLAGKPTIELDLIRDPVWYREEHARANICCGDPAQLPAVVDAQLGKPLQRELHEVRQRHLERYLSLTDGKSCERIASLIAEALRKKKPTDWSKLSTNDYRRAIKLAGFRQLGLAYHYDPLLTLKRKLAADAYAVKDYAYKKSIKPRDVREANHRLMQALSKNNLRPAGV